VRVPFPRQFNGVWLANDAAVEVLEVSPDGAFARLRKSATGQVGVPGTPREKHSHTRAHRTRLPAPTRTHMHTLAHVFMPACVCPPRVL
jgi:hypothetical protein